MVVRTISQIWARATQNMSNIVLKSTPVHLLFRQILAYRCFQLAWGVPFVHMMMLHGFDGMYGVPFQLAANSDI